MKKLVFLAFMALATMLSAQKTDYYEGNLEFKGQKLPLTLEVSISKDTIAFLGSPAQTKELIPATKIVLRNDSLMFSVKQLKATFKGKINETKDSVFGNFKQMFVEIPLCLVKKEKPEITINRPQNPPANPSYIQEEITFRTQGVDYDFKGTLTYPKKEGKYPLMIMISGSGLQNRDEEIMQHRPFAVIADYMANNGIAVFRYDDRGFGSENAALFNATTFDYAIDVESALNALKNHPNIDADKIGLVGHSEGGLIAPIVASRNSEVDFLILLAGPGVNGMEVLVEQTKAILKVNGYSKKEIEEQLKALKNGELAGHSHPWMKCFLELEPSVYLEKVKQPVLVLNGTKDLQVLYKQNLPAIEKALKKGGNKSYKIHKLKGLNHLFQECKTGSPNEYFQIEQTISPKVLKLMKDFVK
ncbi:MAG: alpha/beta fold hydrolase [Bacteroidales bacterium]|nr:alpha/beta fold hydrolase [Bacteroidales bacterium]